MLWKFCTLEVKMESVERKQVGGWALRSWRWAGLTVQLGLLQEVVLQVGSQPEENSLWCKQTVYIESFIWKWRLMFGAICTFSGCSAASWEISRCWAPSISNWNKGRWGQSEKLPWCTIWAAWTSAGPKLVHHNLCWFLKPASRCLASASDAPRKGSFIFGNFKPEVWGKNTSLEDHCGNCEN